MQSEEINELSAALSKLQGSILPAPRDSKNPHLKNTYADLNSIWESVRSQIAANGLSVAQYGVTVPSESGCVLETLLMHSSGQWISGRIPINPTAQKGVNESQAFGSAISYMRRYSLASMLGVITEDDDADTAGPRKTAEKPGQDPQVTPKSHKFRFLDVCKKEKERVGEAMYYPTLIAEGVDKASQVSDTNVDLMSTLVTSLKSLPDLESDDGWEVTLEHMIFHYGKIKRLNKLVPVIDESGVALFTKEAGKTIRSSVPASEVPVKARRKLAVTGMKVLQELQEMENRPNA